MLKLMARSASTQGAAATLIGAREASVAQALGRSLAGHGYQFKTRIHLPGGVGEIDLLAMRSTVFDELLVAEVKAVLEPDEINEVEHATREMKKGQRQLAKIIDYLAKAPIDEKTAIWKSVPWKYIEKYYGLVVTPDVQPNSTYDHRQFPAIALTTIASYFYPNDFRSPRRIWQAAVAKRWLRRFENARHTFHPLRVGELTYEIPIRLG